MAPRVLGGGTPNLFDTSNIRDFTVVNAYPRRGPNRHQGVRGRIHLFASAEGSWIEPSPSSARSSSRSAASAGRREVPARGRILVDALSDDVPVPDMALKLRCSACRLTCHSRRLVPSLRLVDRRRRSADRRANSGRGAGHRGAMRHGRLASARGHGQPGRHHVGRPSVCRSKLRDGFYATRAGL